MKFFLQGLGKVLLSVAVVTFIVELICGGFFLLNQADTIFNIEGVFCLAACIFLIVFIISYFIKKSTNKHENNS